MTKTVEKSLFVEAADFLEAREWGQGALYCFSLRGARYCVIGALQACASANPHLPSKRSDRAVDQLDALVTTDYGQLGVMEWNDEDGRTKEEVIALLREADQQQRTQGRLNV